MLYNHEDISDECILAVCRKFKQMLESNEDKEKFYSGYTYADGSQLIWIPPNHKIEIK